MKKQTHNSNKNNRLDNHYHFTFIKKLSFKIMRYKTQLQISSLPNILNNTILL